MSQPLTWELEVPFPQGWVSSGSGKGWNSGERVLEGLTGKAETGQHPSGSFGCRVSPQWPRRPRGYHLVKRGCPSPSCSSRILGRVSCWPGVDNRPHLEASLKEHLGVGVLPAAPGGSLFSPSQSSKPPHLCPSWEEVSLPGLLCLTLYSSCLHSLSRWDHQLFPITQVPICKL